MLDIEACLHLKYKYAFIGRMKQTISKKQAVEAYGSVGGLADALGITRSAIYQWPDGPIADVHALRILFVLRPPGLDEVLKGEGAPCTS